MKKILAIGNSFSNDATHYLFKMTQAAGEEMKLANLYIGGCSLARHSFNAMARSKDYLLMFNSVNTGFYVSIHEALMSDQWDIITLQQASHYSPFWDTYQPFLTTLHDYLKEYAPKSELMVHQTWGYEDGYERLEKLGFASHDDMFAKVQESYGKMADFLGAKIIPSGRAIQLAYDQKLCRMHRDGFHLDLGAGRFTAASVWLETLFGADAAANAFRDFDEPVSEELRVKLAACAHQATEEYR